MPSFELKRRSFLGAMLAAAVAPAFIPNGVTRGIVMPVRALPVIAPPIWKPEVLDISAYIQDHSYVAFAPLEGERELIPRSYGRAMDIRFAGLAAPMLDAFVANEVVEVLSHGFSGAFMLTQVQRNMGYGVGESTSVSMTAVKGATAKRVLDLRHL